MISKISFLLVFFLNFIGKEVMTEQEFCSIRNPKFARKHGRRKTYYVRLIDKCNIHTGESIVYFFPISGHLWNQNALSAVRKRY